MRKPLNDVASVLPTESASLRLLIVEDEQTVAFALEQMLEKMGYSIVGIAKSFNEATRLLAVQTADMVLTDIFLSGEKTGIDLAERLKEMNIPFIFISAFADEKTLEKARATQPYGYLTKPFREKDIYATLEVARYRHAHAEETRLRKEKEALAATLAEREREKATLLSISEALATIRVKEQLLKVVFEKVRPLFGFDDMGLYVFDSDRQFMEDWSKTLPGANPSKADVQPRNQKVGKIRYKQSVIELRINKLKDAKGPLIVPYTEKLITQFPNQREQSGYKECMAALLRTDEGELGVLQFNSKVKGNFKDVHLMVFQAIADQIAVAVANILANEQLEHRQKETALQLAVINALAQAPDWERRFLALITTIQPHLPFDYCVVGLESGGHTRHDCHMYRTGPDEYQTLTLADVLRLSGLTFERYGQLRQQADRSRPLLLNGEDLALHNQKDGLTQAVCQSLRLESYLLLPIPLTYDAHFTLSLYHRQEEGYQPSHLSLGQRLSTSIGMTLERLLAYEQVAALSEQLLQQNTYLREEVDANYQSGEIVGNSPVVREVFRKIHQVAPTDSTVLILGESGTGKELIARAIHNQSPRKDQVMVKLNCAALPASIIESELFGHEKGAFTGAIERRIGKFELANKGTIFLDEVGEMPLELQAKLLRVLQEREIERLGGNKPIKCDVRVLAATNRNLEKEVAEGRFRLDLYYRLNVFPILLPPLRERKEDIVPLATFFAHKFSRRMGKSFQGFSKVSTGQLLSYHWPGNIRELENLVEQALIISDGKSPLEWGRVLEKAPQPVMALGGTGFASQNVIGKTLSDFDEAQQSVQRSYLLAVLRQTNGRIRGEGGAAELLDVKPTTLESRLARLGIFKEHYIRPEGQNYFYQIGRFEKEDTKLVAIPP